MSSANNPGQRELVFCHECQNEFWKDQHGLTCPDCHSDFTEVIDHDTDPRNDEPPANIFTNQNNPWSTVPDPDEVDLPSYSWTSPDGRSNISFRATYSSNGNVDGGNLGPGGPGLPPLGGLGGLLSAMARPGGLPGFAPLPPRHNNEQTPGQPGEQGQRSPTGHTHFEFRSSGGPAFMFGSTGAPGNMEDRGRDPRAAAGNTQIEDLHHMVHSMLSSMGVPQHEGGAQGGMPGHPFSHILNNMFNPANAQMGNAVFTDEAFDRILSQLMDQHSSGNAPGPASAAAISSLPRTKASAKELGQEMQAECSICMDTVTEGVEINTLPCSHWFHPDCVRAWLSEHDTCPVCRAGITPKEGSRDEAREPSQAPLNNEDPVFVARRQSGTQGNPIVVPESPTRERRQPNFRRNSSGNPLDTIDEGGRSSQQGGIGSLVRGLFTRNSSGNNNNANSNSNREHDEASR